LYANPEKQADTNPIPTYLKEICPEISNPFKVKTPKKAREKKNHCLFLIFSFKIQIAKKAVKIGDRYVW